MSTWPRVKLGDCCEIVSGSTPRRDVPRYWNGNIPWATPRDISTLDGRVLTITAEGITEEGYRSCSTARLPAGSILFSSRAPIGLVAIAGVPLCTNQGFKSLIPGPSIATAYLYWTMRQLGKRLAARGSGSTFAEVSKEVVARFEIPLPPMKEQLRIVAVLEKVNAIREKAQTESRLMDFFPRSVFLEILGDPFRNERGWEVQRLRDLAIIRRGASPRPIHQFLGGDVPWIKISDATRAGGLYINDTVDGVTSEGASKSVLLQQGSIVVANSGVSLGFARILNIRGCIHDGWLSVENLDKRLDKLYFVSLINMMTSQLRATAPSGTQPNLNTTIAGNLRIPIPPRDVQQRFVKVLKKGMQLSGRVRAAAGVTDKLASAVIQRAFDG